VESRKIVARDVGATWVWNSDSRAGLVRVGSVGGEVVASFAETRLGTRGLD
jgi:hypothetical protein